MADPFLGEIKMFAGNFAPRGWAFCDGQLLSISQNTALFSLLGTNYGGNGQTTFALPDLRGRSPLHPGQGPGLSNRMLGEKGGTQNVRLTAAQMPVHGHALRATQLGAGSTNPSNRFNAVGQKQYNNTTDGTVMASNSIALSGGGEPHENMTPFLAVPFIIALEGIYPSRN